MFTVVSRTYDNVSVVTASGLFSVQSNVTGSVLLHLRNVDVERGEIECEPNTSAVMKSDEC